jgi:hypothetical protein
MASQTIFLEDRQNIVPVGGGSKSGRDGTGGNQAEDYAQWS